MVTDLISAARHFALHAHRGQKYGIDHPYSAHLVDVNAVLLSSAGSHLSPDLLAAGWLHDVIEDCNISPIDIERLFGRKVGELVWAVAGIGESRHMRNESIYVKLEDFPEAQSLKVADRIANIEAARRLPVEPVEHHYLKMYLREMNGFLAATRKAGCTLLARLHGCDGD